MKNFKSIVNKIDAKIIALTASMPLLLSGCADSTDIYDLANTEVNNTLGTGGGHLLSPESYLALVNKVKWYVPYFILLSFGIAILFGFVFKHAPAKRRKIILIFVFAIPILLIVFRYALAYVYSMEY